MNTNAAINEYRKKHHRCKTCVHADNVTTPWYTWRCKAKCTKHSGNLYETKFIGMFCGLYEPVLFGE